MGQAIEDYSKAIEISPQFTHAIFNRGIAYYRMGKNKASIKDFTKVVSLDEFYAKAYFNRSFPLEKQKKYEKAIKDVKKALKLSPNNQRYFSPTQRFKKKGRSPNR